MMDLHTMRTNLTTALDAISGFNVYPLIDNPDLNAITVLPHTPFNWRDAFDDTSEHRVARFLVRIEVAYTDEEPAQDLLDDTIVLAAAAVDTVANAGVTTLELYGVLIREDGARTLVADLLVEYEQ